MGPPQRANNAKKRLNISPAEMVFSETSVVSGEFFPSCPEADDAAAAHNLADHRRIVEKYRPVVKTHNNNHPFTATVT